MSTTEPAPLPRLGEVFFDVRSTARSLRISWYSDTGVAVLSIWQGGTCTGSFRLPMGDVPRLIAALQAGPSAAHSRGSLHYPGGAATPPYAGQAPAPAADPYGSGPYPASPATGYPPAAAAGYPAASEAAGYPGDGSGYPAGGYPAAGYPAAAPAAAVPPVSAYPADPYPPGPSGYAPPPAPSASPSYPPPYGNSGEYTRTGDFLRPAYLDAAAEPPAAGHGHRPGSHRASQGYGTDQDYRAGQEYGAGQDYRAGHDYGTGQEWSPVAVGVSTGPLPESHPYDAPGGPDGPHGDPPGSSGSFA